MLRPNEVHWSCWTWFVSEGTRQGEGTGVDSKTHARVDGLLGYGLRSDRCRREAGGARNVSEVRSCCASHTARFAVQLLAGRGMAVLVLAVGRLRLGVLVVGSRLGRRHEEGC